jgi:SAM-dependent methyltransferase
VSNVVAAEIGSTTDFLQQSPEQFEYGSSSNASLSMSLADIRRYESPRENTVFPLEYVFHLLGNLQGRTVIDLGCGDGVNTVILASLGATVFSIDISRESLALTAERAAANRVDRRVTLLNSDAMAIPIEAGMVDAILCTGLLHQVDSIKTARQIRRVLRPGGVAVFDEAVAGPAPFARENEDSLSIRKVDAICRAVGMPGRRREFWLATRFICRIGARTFTSAAKAAQRFDAAVLQRFPFTRKLASPLVWEARKES